MMNESQARYALYRLKDMMSILFAPDNDFRKRIEKEVNAMLEDLEKNCDDDIFDDGPS